MSTALSLAMQISANTAGLASAVRDVEKKLDRLAASAEKTTQKLSGLKVLADIGAVGFGVTAIINTISRGYNAVKGFAEAASSTQQEIAKVGQVFGDAAGLVEDFAQSTTMIGISNTQALAASASFGNLFTALGGAKDEAADMSIQMVQLAADLAAFNNTSTQEALNALGSGLRGEQEPLKRFGIVLSDSVLKQKAFEQGLIQTRTQALTPLLRAQLAYQVALEQSANAQGQALREADTYGGVMRRIAAVMDNLSGKIGEALVPILKKIGLAFLEVGPEIEKAIGGIAEAFESVDIATIIESLVKVISGLTVAFIQLASVILPVIGTVLQPLADLFGWLAEDSEALAAGLLGAAVAYGGYVVGSALATVTTMGFSAALTSLLATTGIGLILPLLGFGALYFAQWATGADDAADATDDMAKATADAKDLTDQMTETQERMTKALNGTTEAANKAKEAFKFDIKDFGPEQIAEGAVSAFESGYKKLAQELGSIDAIPEDLQVAWKRINDLTEMYNSGVANSAEDLERINREARIFQKMLEEHNATLEKQKKIQQEIAEAGNKARERVNELIEEGKSPSDKAREQYLKDLKATQRYVQDAEKAMHDAWRKGDQDAINAARARYDLARKQADRARKVAENNYREQELAARGIEESLYKVAETTSDQIAAVLQAYRDKLLTGEEARRALTNLAEEGIQIREELNKELSTPSTTMLEFKDITSTEGMKEYFRLASGESDPAIDQRREQLQKLAAIERALRENGLRPVDILGGVS